MSKIHLRTIFPCDQKVGWDNDEQRESLKQYLNDLGFYAVTQGHDWIEVYAIQSYTPVDVKLCKNLLKFVKNMWKCVRRRHGD